MQAKHYYEIHITIEPVFDDRLEGLKHIALMSGFKVASLLMKKRAEDTEQRSRYDTFMTSHTQVLSEAIGNVRDMTRLLQREGFKVWRYKIEDIVLDSRIKDELNLLGE